MFPDPGVRLVAADVVVVSELVALIDAAVGIVEVVLENDAVVGEVALGEIVDISPEFAAEEVADSLVVMSVSIVERYARL